MNNKCELTFTENINCVIKNEYEAVNIQRKTKLGKFEKLDSLILM